MIRCLQALADAASLEVSEDVRVNTKSFLNWNIISDYIKSHYSGSSCLTILDHAGSPKPTTPSKFMILIRSLF